MMETLKLYGDESWPVPDNVEEVELDAISGYAAHDGFPSAQEWVVKGTLPVEDDPIHVKFPVCKGDPSRKATEVMIAQGNYDTVEKIVIREEDPLTPDNLWQKGIDKWLATQTDEKYKIPSEYCGEVKGVHVEIVDPDDRSRTDESKVTVRATVYSDAEIDWIKLYLNDNLELENNGKNTIEKEFELEAGAYKVRVVARNKSGVESDRIHNFGVKQNWDEVLNPPTPTATPTLSPTPTP